MGRCSVADLDLDEGLSEPRTIALKPELVSQWIPPRTKQAGLVEASTTLHTL